MSKQSLSTRYPGLLAGRRGLLLVCVVLTVLAAVTYQGVRDNFFSCDDFAWLRNARITLQQPSNIFTTDIAGWFRPVGHLAFAINYWLFGLDHPVAYPLVSVAFHILTTFLLYLLFRQLLGNAAIAFWAAVFFVVQHTHWEAVAWSSIIAELLVLFWGLGAILCFVKWRDISRQPHRLGQRFAGIRYYLGTNILLTLSYLSAESAVTIPAMLLFTDLLYCPKIWKKHPFRAVAAYIPLFVVWLTYVIYEIWLQLSHRLHIGGDYQVGFQFPVVMLRSLLAYIFPKALLTYMLQSQGLLLAVFWSWLLLIVFGVLALIGFRLSSRHLKHIGYSLLWISITILPFCGFTRFTIIDSRHYYLPSVGVSLLFGIAVYEWYRRLQIRSSWQGIVKKGILALFVGGVLSWNMIELWHEDKIFEEYANEGLEVLTALQHDYSDFPSHAKIYFTGLHTPPFLLAQMIDMYFSCRYSHVHYRDEAWIQQQRERKDYDEPVYLFARQEGGLLDLTPDQFKYRLPQNGCIDIGNPVARKYLWRGFSYTEKWADEEGTSFAWSNQKHSRLKVAFGDVDRNIEMTLRIRPFEFDGAPQQTITVYLNEHKVGTLHLQAGVFAPYTITLPHALFTDTNTLLFRYEYSASPSQVTDGKINDGRELGVAFDAMSFLPITPNDE